MATKQVANTPQLAEMLDKAPLFSTSALSRPRFSVKNPPARTCSEREAAHWRLGRLNRPMDCPERCVRMVGEVPLRG